MNYEQYKEMISEEAEATESIFTKIIISGVCVNKNDKDGSICFLSRNAKKCLSPTVYSILSSKDSFFLRAKICKLYGKKTYQINTFGSVIYLTSTSISYIEKMKIYLKNKIKGCV